MKRFRTQGLWWVPQSDTKLPGTLFVSDSGELRLAVTGTFPEFQNGLFSVFDNQVGRECAVILGQVTGCRLGATVTLKDCFLSRITHSLPWNPAANRQEFRAHRAFFGAHLPSPEDESFVTAVVQFSGLSSWAASLSGFKSLPSPPYFAWEDPGAIPGTFPGGSFTLVVDASGQMSFRKKTTTETVEVRLSFDAPRNQQQAQADILYPLLNLFTFATDQPNAVTQCRFYRDTQNHEPIYLLGPRTFSDESVAADLVPVDMLFSLSDIGDRCGDILSTWLNLSKRYSSAFAIYFSNLYRPPGFTDVRLMLNAQVLSLYYASRHGALGEKTTGERADPSSVDALRPVLSIRPLLPADLLASFDVLLESHPVVSAARAISELTREYGQLFEPLVRSGREAFVRRVVDLLTYLFTRDEKIIGSPYPDGAELYWVAEKLAFLFKIALLHDLGFDPTHIKELLERNRRYQHIRDTQT